jgi:hypothetical protein
MLFPRRAGASRARGPYNLVSHSASPFSSAAADEEVRTVARVEVGREYRI